MLFLLATMLMQQGTAVVPQTIWYHAQLCQQELISPKSTGATAPVT
jgi:hypothetical protein